MIEEYENKIKGMKIVLQDCKQMFVAEKSFLVQCSRLEDINNIIEKIDNALIEWKICENPIAIKEIMGIKIETIIEFRRLALQRGFSNIEDFIKDLRK